MLYVIAFSLGALVIGLDQLTKYIIMQNFQLHEGCKFINGLIAIYRTENDGAAWGIFGGKTWLLLTITIVVMTVCIFLLIKTFKGSRLMLFAITLVISGGIGNLYDRIFRDGNVVDFLQFEFWKDFPVFNVADCAISVGAGLLILYLLIDTVKEYKIKKEAKPENGDN